MLFWGTVNHKGGKTNHNSDIYYCESYLIIQNWIYNYVRHHQPVSEVFIFLCSMTSSFCLLLIIGFLCPSVGLHLPSQPISFLNMLHVQCSSVLIMNIPIKFSSSEKNSIPDKYFSLMKIFLFWNTDLKGKTVGGLILEQEICLCGCIGSTWC